jgi:hypothetical protein
MTYADKLKDPRWQRRRLAIMERDGFACKDCKATDKQLHVHHLIYSQEPWDAGLGCLVTVCWECHAKRHTTEKRLKELIAKLGYLHEGLLHSLVNAIEDTLSAPDRGEKCADQKFAKLMWEFRE